MGFFDFFCMNCGKEGSTYEDPDQLRVSRVLSERSRNRVEESRALRSVFLSVTPVYVKPQEGHTHAESAAARNSATQTIRQIAHKAGKRLVYLQASSSDVKKGDNAIRTWLWVKDQNVMPQSVAKHDNDMVAMVDVDYYFDMNKFLMNNFKPVIMYTFQPGNVSKDSGEYNYTFNEGSVVRYDVSGGGLYIHKVWNYAGDSLGVRLEIFGFPVAYATYSVERKRIDDDHQLVLLAPLRKYYWRSAYLAVETLAAGNLERLDVVRGEFTRLMINTNLGMEVCTGKVGGYLSSRTLASVDDAIASAQRTSRYTLTKSNVETKMKAGSKAKTCTRGVEILLEYHLSMAGAKPAPVLNVLDDYVRSFQFADKVEELDEDAKPSMVSFMKPIIDGAFVPADCKNNEQRAVNARLLELKDLTVMSSFVESVVMEFVHLFSAGQEGFLEPVDVDVVYERQSRPTQQRILFQSEHDSPDRETISFVKKEAYQKPNDPRIISTINGVDKREYSRFTYALADYLKQFEWYAFGKTPLEIANRVAEIGLNAETHIDGTDFSRMDGRIGKVPRYLEKVVMKTVFRKEFHEELEDLMGSQHSIVGRTRHGVTYETGLARLSGSPETSVFNTLLSAFTAFLACRMSRPSHTTRYYTPIEAWNKLGMYGGDDGITSDLNRSSQEKAARAVGQLLKVERAVRGELGLKFLSRHYGPDVWYGDNNSCCDIYRAVSKFHVTVRLPSNITPAEKMKEKAYAMYLSDSETPILGPFVSKVMSENPTFKYKNVLGVWNSDVTKESHYPNRFADWMVDTAVAQLPGFSFQMYEDWLKQASGGDLLNAPQFMERPQVELPKKGVLFESGEVLEAPAAAAEQTTKPTSRKMSRDRKKKSDRPNRGARDDQRNRRAKQKAVRHSRPDEGKA